MNCSGSATNLLAEVCDSSYDISQIYVNDFNPFCIKFNKYYYITAYCNVKFTGFPVICRSGWLGTFWVFAFFFLSRTLNVT